MTGLGSLIPAELRRILSETPALAEAYIVGGAVRDALLGFSSKDLDLEVFGVSYDQLAKALSPWGRTDLVGKSFGVLKLRAASGVVYDFSLPRRDSKRGPGHKGFEIDLLPNVTLKEAAGRRDFTINALMFDPRREQVLDFFDGQGALERRILRHTTPAFVEDPLRVLRGMQLAGRFDLKADPETLALCRQIRAGYGELVPDRIRDEWCKWAAKSARPSAGLRFLDESGWIEHYPELAALRTTAQDPEWHPEGNVFLHTGHCLDALSGLPEWRAADETTRLVWTFAVLTHDFGKSVTTHEALKEGRWRVISPGHDEAGVNLAAAFLRRIHLPEHLIGRVLPLVAQHMAHLWTLTERSVRKLSKRLEPETIESLCVVLTADHMGRPPLPQVVPESVRELRRLAAKLNVQAAAPRRILTGSHLLELRIPPGRDLGSLLEHAYELQLEGEIATLADAYRWLAGQSVVPLSTASREALRAVWQRELPNA